MEVQLPSAMEVKWPSAMEVQLPSDPELLLLSLPGDANPIHVSGVLAEMPAVPALGAPTDTTPVSFMMSWVLVDAFAVPQLVAQIDLPLAPESGSHLTSCLLLSWHPAHSSIPSLRFD